VREFPLLEGGEIDRRLSLRPGTAVRLARRDKLPHIVLPDGAIRFSWPDVAEALKQVVPARSGETEAAHD
jgi:hypothetical protein